MSQAQILDYAKTCLIIILRLSLIPILVATVIGIIVSLLQALTQIQEPSLHPGHLHPLRVAAVAHALY